MEPPNSRVGAESVLVAGSYSKQVWENSMLLETLIKRVLLNIEKDVTLDIIDGKNASFCRWQRMPGGQ